MPYVTSLRLFLEVNSRKKIIKLIVEMIVGEMIPIGTVQHSGFQNLLHYSPWIHHSCRQSLVSAIEAKYDELKLKAMDLVSGSQWRGIFTNECSFFFCF